MEKAGQHRAGDRQERHPGGGGWAHGGQRGGGRWGGEGPTGRKTELPKVVAMGMGGGIGYVNEAQVKVGKVDLRAIDKGLFEQSNLDPRIKSAVLVDPGLAQAYDAQSLRDISVPMSFINLGSLGTIPPGVIADDLASLTPHGAYRTVADSVHYSFLPECREGAAEILRSSGEDEPICEDGGARARADIHAELVRLIPGDLQRTLAP